MTIQVHEVSVALLVAAALGVLVLVGWSAFVSRARSIDLRRPVVDFGLLVPVARLESDHEAGEIRDLLVSIGIRATTAATPGGAVVLVFPSDARRARDLVGVTEA